MQVGVLGCPQLKFNAENVSETEHDDLGTIFVAVRGHGAYKVHSTEKFIQLYLTDKLMMIIIYNGRHGSLNPARST